MAPDSREVAASNVVSMFVKGFLAILAAFIAPGEALLWIGTLQRINWLYYVGLSIFILGEVLLVFVYGIMIEMDRQNSRDRLKPRMAFQLLPIASFLVIFFGGIYFAWLARSL